MSAVETGGVRDGFVFGSPALGSVGPAAFGPDGTLFVADNLRAQIVAFDLTADTRQAGIVEVESLDERLAAFLGCAAGDVFIRDLLVHPVSGAVYLPVMRGAGDSAVPLVLRIGDDGGFSSIALDGVGFARTWVDGAPAADDEREELSVLPDGDPEGERLEVPQVGATLWVQRDRLRATTVTDLAFVDGELLVAGASNEEFISTLRRIPFPFGGPARTSLLEIFHVSHGKYETHSPIRTFIPYGGGASVLASYTCTPIVHFPLSALAGSGKRAVGRTVADLGAMSSPADIVSFTRDGDEYVLISNTRLPLMKAACRDIDAQQGLTERRGNGVTVREPFGVPLEELPHEGVSRMAVADGHVLMLQRDGAGLHLRAYDSAAL